MNLTNPDNPAVIDALTRKCDQCKAPAGSWCVKRGGLRDDLANRLIHFGRMAAP